MEHLSNTFFTAMMQDMIGQYTGPPKPAPETPDPSKPQAQTHTAEVQNQVGYYYDSSMPIKREDPKVGATLPDYTDGQRSGGFPKNHEQPPSSAYWLRPPPGLNDSRSTQQGQWQYSGDSTLPIGLTSIPAQQGNQIGLGNGKESLFHWINDKGCTGSRLMMNQEALMHTMGDEMMRVKKEQSLQRLKDMIKEEDFTAKFGAQLVNWADLSVGHVFGNDRSCYNLHTETFSNMLMAFKCTLMKEHRKYFYSTVEPGLSHPGFKRPKLDDDFMDMFLDKQDSEAKINFLQSINPLNNYLENIQHLMLMANVPLFLACNNFEVNPLTAASSSTDLLVALKRTILLCRRSLVLYGQTFAFISAMRQEKILDALDLKGKPPPPPSHYPNLEDEFLFGKDYLTELRINELRHWKKKDKFPTMNKPDSPATQEELKRLPQDTLKDVPAHVDAKMKVTIEKLARLVIEMGPEMEAINIQRMASNPEFWFLNAKETAAYKLFQIKVDELRQTHGLSSDSSKMKPPVAPVSQNLQSKITKTPDPIQKYANPEVVPESHLFTPPLPPGPRSTSSILKATNSMSDIVPQTLHPTIPSQKQNQQEHPTIPSEKLHQEPCKISNEMLQQEKSTVAVDAKTKETAEKLAEFVFRIGPHLESVNKANLTSYQEFWFLNHIECPAYRFYEMKLAEFRLSKQLQPVHANNFPLLLSKLLYNIRSTANPVESPLPLNSHPESPIDHGAEPQDVLPLSSELSELCNSTGKNIRSQGHDATSPASHMDKTPPEDLNIPEAASLKHDLDSQNTELEDHPLVTESCDSDSEQSDTEQSKDFLSIDADHLTSQCSDSDGDAPDSELPSPQLKHSDHKPEITNVSLTKTHYTTRNCDSMDSCVNQATAACRAEHDQPKYQTPLLPNYNPPFVRGPELKHHKCQDAGIPAFSSPNCALPDPVLEAPEPPRTACTNIAKGCKNQVSDPHEVELLRFYESIEETERKAEAQKGLHSTTQATSSGPVPSSCPTKRARPETEVHESLVSGNEKSYGQPSLKKKLKKDMMVAFHGRPGLGYTEAQIKKPAKTVQRSVGQSMGASNIPSQEHTLIAFRQKMMQMFKGGLPK
ncbi:uncharacterized protein [Pleurodeles waltl]|uniref:uncharacterized protein isoform X1 n=1 Tax=Pleurodeles waltl TaxID=8319 RepID=UPI00370993C1